MVTLDCIEPPEDPHFITDKPDGNDKAPAPATQNCCGSNPSLRALRLAVLAVSHRGLFRARHAGGNG